MKLAILAFLVFGSLNMEAQTWKPNPKYVKETGKKIASVQCEGTTKKGERCKMKGKPENNGKYYCRFHLEQK